MVYNTDLDWLDFNALLSIIYHLNKHQEITSLKQGLLIYDKSHP